jgi:aldehyde dehydrogenase (NAD+)
MSSSDGSSDTVIRDPAAISGAVDRLRATFDSGVTLTREWRIQQLKAFRSLVSHGKEALSIAMYQDLHRSRFESHLIEISVVEHEIQEAIDHLDDWMAPEAKPTNLLNQPGSSSVHRDPLGVCLIMSPWNYPVQLLLAPLIGAIAAGNCALLRPAEYTGAVSETIGVLIGKYLDPNAFAVVIGGRAITESSLKCRFDKIFFTGGPTLGKVVYGAAVENLTPVVLELGGKSPAYVDASANLSVTARRLTWGTFLNAGQTCVRPDYLLVHESVADELIARIVGFIREFYEVPATDKTEYAYSEAAAQRPTAKTSPYFGRIVNGGGAIDRLAGLLERDKAHIVTGGEVDKAERYVAPTVLDFGTDVDAFEASSAMQAEIFGPILPVLRVSGPDAALAAIKRREKPLAMYVFTNSAAVKKTFETRTTAGGLVFNDCVVHLANGNLPFGGVGHSGMGNYHGRYSFECFSHQKAVMDRKSLADMPARYPPYTSFKRNLIYVRFRLFVIFYGF